MTLAIGDILRLALRWTLAAVVALQGLILAWGGMRLLLLGGSWYYLPAGLLLVVAAVLAARRDRRALRCYALVLLATTIWALWEVGLDGWQLLPRLFEPYVLALLLMWPWRAQEPSRQPWTLAGFAGGVILASLAGLGLRALGPDGPQDPMLARGMTPAQQVANSVAPVTDPAVDGDWPYYGNDLGGTRFSRLAQLNAQNVSGLKLAWTYQVGPAPDGSYPSLEVTPLKVAERLYLCTGYSDVIALDAETGQQAWRYSPQADLEGVPLAVCRGVAYYRVPRAKGACAARIIATTVDARLIALDAADGKLCDDFGVHGQTSLLAGMGDVEKGYYYVTSAPTVVRGNIILGGWVSDGQYWGEPSGVIRAFDAMTGQFAWAFDAGRPDDHQQPVPGQSYTRSTPNSWAPMSADEDLGLVYAPTGNAVPDYYGAQRRPFDDHVSSSVIALDAETGALRWAFQTLRHDLWDYDVPAQPTLIDLQTPQGPLKALVQATKRGEVFVLDRTNGKPIAPVADRPVPTRGAAPGERVVPTQPFSVGMPSFRGPDLQESSMWGVTPFDQLYCRIKFREARYEGTLTPPGLTPSINFPGYMGGMNWGGVSIDHERSLMIVNSSRVPVAVRLVPRAEADRQGIRYQHGAPLTVHGGGGQPHAGTPFAVTALPMLSPSLAPCNAPPWGIVAAVDVTSGKLVWWKPLGTALDSGPLGIPSMLPIPVGLPNTGGSITTRGGLTFIAASQERAFRALDTSTGRELWSTRLPAGGQATPATYWSDRSQRQFVVIAAGGSKLLLTPPGDAIQAYALTR